MNALIEAITLLTEKDTKTQKEVQEIVLGAPALWLMAFMHMNKAQRLETAEFFVNTAKAFTAYEKVEDQRCIITLKEVATCADGYDCIMRLRNTEEATVAYIGIIISTGVALHINAAAAAAPTVTSDPLTFAERLNKPSTSSDNFAA